MSITPEQPTDKPEEEGGHAWELDRASRNLADAIGNPAAQNAALDFAAALNNSMSGVLIPTLGATLQAVLHNELGGVRQQMTVQSEQLAEAIAAISTVDRRVDLSNSRAVDRWAQMQDHLDARFDNFGTEIDGVVTQIGGVKSAVDTLHAGFSEIGEKVDSIAFRQDEQATLLAQVVANQSEMDARQTELERQVGINGGVIAELRENDKAKFRQLETLSRENRALGKRIDALTKTQLDAAKRQRQIEEAAAVGVMSGEERARLMLWFQANAPKLQALIDANEAQQADER